MDFLLLGAIFSLIMGVSLYLNWQGRYIAEPLLFGGYFFLASVLIMFCFPSVLALVPPARSLLIVFSAYLVAVLAYAAARRSFSRPSAFVAHNGTKNAFIRLEYPFLFTKGFEIAFQQLCFAVFILLVARAGLALPQMAMLSGAALLILHLPLWLTHGMRWGSFYVASALVLGFIFPYLVLTVPAGLAFAFSLHLLAYVAAGAVVWGVQSMLLQKKI